MSRKKSRFLKQLEKFLEDLDDSKGYVYAIEGKRIQCSICGEPVNLPPVKIPVRIEAKKSDTPEGMSDWNYSTVYWNTHFACAVRYLLAHPGSEVFLPNTNDENKDKTGDSNG